MEGHGEAAADVITGGVVARAVEPAAGEAHVKESHSEEAHAACLNCGVELTGAYCANCGQNAHPHRSLVSLGHDILHGVFHFEGKVWNTLPELFLRPGRLTRRYIDGERAKFVSPMALYLFSVFLMFAVFSFSGDDHLSLPAGADFLGVGEQWKQNIQSDIDDLNDKIESQREKLAEVEMTPAQRETGEKNLAGLIAARDAMEAMLSGDMNKMTEFFNKQQLAKEQAESAAAEAAPAVTGAIKETENRLESAVKQVSDNPALLTYKLKTAGYKYSWALVPLSVPFMWLLFFWRRDIHAYDHAIFVTYSISFMMLFVVLLSLASTLGVSAAIWGAALAFIPPLHLYKQLRYAYGLSRFGAWMRLFLLSIMIFFVLVMFGTLLLALGVTS